MFSLSITTTVLFLLMVLTQETPLPQESSAEQGVRPDIEANYAQSESEAEALGQKNKEFMEKFYNFRESNKKLNALKVEYPTAKPERQEKIDKEYWSLYNNGLATYKQMFSIGFEAFDEAPNRNPFVNNLLYGMVEWEYRRENYEQSVTIFKRLVAKGIAREAEVLYAYAGLAALLTTDVDEAESWLKTATDNGYLEKVLKNIGETQKGQEQVMALEGFYNRMPQFKIDWAKESEIRKTETEIGEKDPAKKLPRVQVKTTKGTIVIELFENEAPNTVANFISLVEKGFYNGTVFHRVLPQFMAQGGDPTGTGRGGPGYAFNDECGSKFPNARKHFRGSLSMANAGPNTNGSQFFLTFVPTYFLDGRHTVFGRVVEGIEVLAEIQRVDPQDEDSIIPVLDKIEEAKVLNKREHPYEPVKNANQR
ncbi:MAG: peptidylprolyl isomerase [Planctomycetaceae bacterium]|jgi:cyclophilin family peptidyl-prolyl cis-trans isomerase|nr:peptidylprolyl isomerase [Planctomycetaceae bacterium]